MPTAELTEDLRDGFQEIANIAVGQTADKLARSFSAFVQMPIPRVHLLDSADVSMALTALDGDSVVTAVTQAFFGDGISGEALMLFIDAGAGDLSALLGYAPARSDEEQCERVLEMASLLAASCIHGVLAQLNVDALIAHPVLLGRHRNLREMFGEQQFPWDRTLALELNYGFEGYAVRCDLVLLFHQQALPALFGKLELLL